MNESKVRSRPTRASYLSIILLAAASCGTSEMQNYAVGGEVSGLNGTLVLRNNLSDDLTLSANGKFQFATRIVAGTTYQVVVVSDPETQTCVVTNGNGTVANVSISTVVVTCTAD